MSLWTLQTSRTLFEQCVGDAELLDLLSQGPRHLQDVAVAKSRLGENIDARYARVYRVALPSFLGLGYPETGSFPGRHLPSSGENVKLLGTFAFQGATCHLAGKFETTRYLRLKKNKNFYRVFHFGFQGDAGALLGHVRTGATDGEPFEPRVGQPTVAPREAIETQRRGHRRPPGESSPSLSFSFVTEFAFVILFAFLLRDSVLCLFLCWSPGFAVFFVGFTTITVFLWIALGFTRVFIVCYGCYLV